MSLRARLLIVLVALTAGGLVIAGVVTYAAERSFLISRVDQVFTTNVVNSFEDYLDHQLGLHEGVPASGADSGLFSPQAGPHPGPGPGGGRVPVLPPLGTYGIYRASNGTSRSTYVLQGLSPPALPAAPPLTTNLAHPQLSTVDSRAGSGLQYRVLAKASNTGSGTMIIAVPLSDVAQTLSRLRTVELIVIATVVAALALLAWVLIRIGLRPLDRIAATAGAIAGGDLSRRVSPAQSRTEVGRLGLALNAMLGQIEQAFAERGASEERLRRFLSDASHELRTPLASIRGYAELFRMGAAARPEDIAKAMARIEEEAARMGVLVEDLLALARLDEMPQSVHELVDLAPLLEDAAADARAAARDRVVSVSVTSVGRVHGDPSQLRQVLANLTRNALTHTPAGSAIDVSLSGGAGTVTVTVRDHGPGLPPGSEETMFERFWRAEPGRERGRAGAGLGLAIVAAIVDAHGGRVSASNAAGGGAAFAMELPAAPPIDDERPAPAGG